MKKSVTEFFKTNGFYLSFGAGVIALVVALAIYNVNTGKKNQQQNQEINLNEPQEQNMADAEGTEEVQETILDGDMDVPMDMWDTQEIAKEEATEATEPGTEEGEAEDTEVAVMANQTLNYEPLEGLSFVGVEDVAMPVLGNTILPYSMDTTVYFQTLGTYRCNPGMLIQAPEGAEVASVWHGQVTDIQDTKEYGTVVTVDLGSGYQVQYGQLQDVRVAVGEEVQKDTIIGTVAVPTAYFAKEGSHLYLEVAKDDTPINPMDILQVE